MKIQYLLLSAIIISSSTNVLAANKTPPPETTIIKTEVMSDAHSTEHDTAIKNKSFWSQEQKQQAALEKKYKNRIAENADDKQAYNNLAGLYLINNKTTEAIDAYQDAITHNPENSKLFAAISIAYLHQSKYAMAKAMADEALRLDPSMKPVKKINEYIMAKEAAIQAASSVSLKEARESGAILGPTPNDAMHGSKDRSLHISTPSMWTGSH